jgi:hypothetical protein
MQVKMQLGRIRDIFLFISPYLALVRRSARFVGASIFILGTAALAIV